MHTSLFEQITNPASAGVILVRHQDGSCDQWGVTSSTLWRLIGHKLSVPRYLPRHRFELVTGNLSQV